VLEEVGGSDEEEGVDEGEEQVWEAHNETLAQPMGGRKQAAESRVPTL